MYLIVVLIFYERYLWFISVGKVVVRDWLVNYWCCFVVWDLVCLLVLGLLFEGG